MGLIDRTVLRWLTCPAWLRVCRTTTLRRFVPPCRPPMPSPRCARRWRLDWTRPADPPRVRMSLAQGEFLLMPSEFGADVGVKVLTIVPDNTARNIPGSRACTSCSTPKRVRRLRCWTDRDDWPAHGRGVAWPRCATGAGRRAPAAGGGLRRRHPGVQSPAHPVRGGGRKRAVGDVVVAVRRPHDARSARHRRVRLDVPAAPWSGSGPPKPTGRWPKPIW